MGEFYFHLIQQRDFSERIIEALEIIAETSNHPLVFHCSAGKDRTGLLTIILLSTLGVIDEDVIADYCLSAPSTKAIYDRLKSDPQLAPDTNSLPAYFWEVTPHIVSWFLTSLRNKYGSSMNYIRKHGANDSLANRLEKALLM